MNIEDICMHCDKPIYDSVTFQRIFRAENPAPEGIERLNAGLKFYHEPTERSLHVHHYCLMDMMEWVSDKIKRD